LSKGNGIYPDDLKYTKEHEWLAVNGSVGTVGITHYAQSELGDIVYVELPSKGSQVVAGEEFGTVESVKAVSDLFAPVSGKIAKVNDPLKDSPETLNEDCYDEGWMIQIEVSNAAELDELLSSDAYEELLKEHA